MRNDIKIAQLYKIIGKQKEQIADLQKLLDEQEDYTDKAMKAAKKWRKVAMRKDPEGRPMKQLWEARVEKHFSQLDLLSALGIRDRGRLESYETGRIKIPKPIAAKICEILKVDTDTIAFGPYIFDELK